jgi:hypothetical protein
MKITKRWLIKRKACRKGVKWFENQSETECEKIIENLIKEERFSWAIWLFEEIFFITSHTIAHNAKLIDIINYGLELMEKKRVKYVLCYQPIIKINY